MALPRYAVWNNKGGVGKTFVTFVVAAEYARTHPTEIVVVIDMCPQANVSEILLGGNSVSVVVSHNGRPLSEVRAGPHDVHGVTMQVNPDPLARYTKAVQALVALL